MGQGQPGEPQLPEGAEPLRVTQLVFHRTVNELG